MVWGLSAVLRGRVRPAMATTLLGTALLIPEQSPLQPEGSGTGWAHHSESTAFLGHELRCSDTLSGEELSTKK